MGDYLMFATWMYQSLRLSDSVLCLEFPTVYYFLDTDTVHSTKTCGHLTTSGRLLRVCFCCCVLDRRPVEEFQQRV